MNVTVKGQYGNLQKLREDYNVSILPDQIQILTQPKLIESVSGKQFEALVILKNVPFSKYTEGINGRIYQRDLWEMHLPYLEGLPANDSHLDDPAPSQTIGVWHNFRIGEKYPYADLYITNETIAKNIRAGLKTLGVSTSAWGEMLPGSNIVNKNTFSAQSIDAVYNPSMQVFLNREQIIEESIKEQRGHLMESLTTIPSSTVSKLDEAAIKISEANLKNEINTALISLKKSISNNEIEKIKESEERLNAYLTTLEDTGVLKESQLKLKEGITSIKSFYEDHLSTKITSLEEATQNIASLEAKIKEQAGIIDSQKEKLLKLSEALDNSFTKEENTDKETEDLAEKVLNAFVESESERFKLQKENEVYIQDLQIVERIAVSQDERLDLFEAEILNLNNQLKEKENITKQKVEERTFPQKKLLPTPLSVIDTYYKKSIENMPFLKHFEESIRSAGSIEKAIDIVEKIRTEQGNKNDDILSINKTSSYPVVPNYRY